MPVTGESMRDEGDLPGDLIVVWTQQTAQNGETVIALVAVADSLRRSILREVSKEAIEQGLCPGMTVNHAQELCRSLRIFSTVGLLAR